MRNTKYDGVITALCTMYDKSGEVEPQALKAHVNFCIDGGIDVALASAGSGQYVNMTRAQREKTVKTVVDASAGRVPVVAGVLEPGLGEAIENGKIALAAGADALLILPPFYVSVTQEGIYDYFATLYDKLQCDIIVYNYPARIGTNVQPETMAKMMREIPGVIGDKECADYTQFLNTVRQVGDDGSVYSGSDLAFADQVLAGARGGVIAASCILPSQYSEIWKLAKAGDVQKSHELEYKYFSLVKALFGNMMHPSPLKQAMKLMGQDIGEWIPPVTPPDDVYTEMLKKELDAHGLLA